MLLLKILVVRFLIQQFVLSLCTNVTHCLEYALCTQQRQCLLAHHQKGLSLLLRKEQAHLALKNSTINPFPHFSWEAGSEITPKRALAQKLWEVGSPYWKTHQAAQMSNEFVLSQHWGWHLAVGPAGIKGSWVAGGCRGQKTKVVI